MFRDRAEAGQALAKVLAAYKGQPVVIYALPRGGVVLGAEIARMLDAPLDLIIVRKVGHPSQPEYAIGAVAEDGYVLINPEEARHLDPQWIEGAIRAEIQEAQRRRALFVPGRESIEARNKIAIIVDDGLATGLTMQAAIHEIRQRNPLKVIVAVPVAAAETAAVVRRMVDDLVVLEIPRGFFGAIGAFYVHFEQLTDDEVIALMQSSARREDHM